MLSLLVDHVHRFLLDGQCFLSNPLASYPDCGCLVDHLSRHCAIKYEMVPYPLSFLPDCSLSYLAHQTVLFWNSSDLLVQSSSGVSEVPWTTSLLLITLTRYLALSSKL